MRKYVFVTIFFVLIGFLVWHFSFAQTEAEIRKQINDTNDQIAQLDKEIQALSGQIAVTSQQKATLANAIKDLNLKRDQLIKQRKQTEDKISATGLVIKSLDNEISTKSVIIDASRSTISSLIKNLNEQDNESFVEKVLSGSSLSDFGKKYNEILNINSGIKENIESLSDQKKSLTKSKSDKEDEQNKLTTYKKTLIVQEAEITSNKNEKSNLLSVTKNKESEYQKLLAERQKQRDAFESSLAQYEDQLKFILNPKSLPDPKHGVLSWPLSNVFITQLFGVTSSSGRLYRSGSHSGVDFRASIGTEVLSMGSGTVVGVGDTDIYCKGASFGKWVFIKYDNGLSSTFGHLSTIIAKAGDKVKAGTVVALSGNTGHTTGPHLHVSVYASDGAKVDTVPSLSCAGKTFIMPIAASTSYLDPMVYLPMIDNSLVKK